MRYVILNPDNSVGETTIAPNEQFSYNGTPTSDRDFTRKLVGDTDGSVTTGPPVDWSFLLTDGEIDLFLSKSAGDCYLAASRLCLALAASNLICARAVQLGQFKTSHEAETHWEKLSEKYQEQSNLAALPVDSAVAWTRENWPELMIYKALRGESN